MFNSSSIVALAGNSAFDEKYCYLNQKIKKMKIRIERKGNEGESPTLSLFADGKRIGFDHRLSRLLTNTTDEEWNGIFEGGWISFFREDGSSTCVSFNDFNIEDMSVLEIRDEIVKRINAVNDAFDEKKISFSEVVEFEI